MSRPTTTLSHTRIRRLRTQGFTCQTDQELGQLAFGIRFPFRICLALGVIGVLTQSVAVFTFMLIVSFFGMILPNHPFDYIYNHFIAPSRKRPRLPARPASLRFTCAVATLWLATVVILLTTGHTGAGLMMGGILAGLALLPSTTDFCVPTAIYNALFARNRTFAFGEGCA